MVVLYQLNMKSTVLYKFDYSWTLSKKEDNYNNLQIMNSNNSIACIIIIILIFFNNFNKHSKIFIESRVIKDKSKDKDKRKSKSNKISDEKSFSIITNSETPLKFSFSEIINPDASVLFKNWAKEIQKNVGSVSHREVNINIIIVNCNNISSV